MLNKIKARFLRIIPPVISLVLTIRARIFRVLKSVYKTAVKLVLAFCSLFVFDNRDVTLVAAGVDAEKLLSTDSKEEEFKFRAIGSIVCITSVFAFLGALFFFDAVLYPEKTADYSSVDGRSEYLIDILKFVVIVTFASLWALMVLNLDRLFLGSMLGVTGFRKYSIGLLRILLAAMLGYAISHPIKMKFFEPEITAYKNILIDIRRAEDAPRLKRELDTVESALEEAEKKLNELNSQSSLLEKIDKLDKHLDQIKLLYKFEKDGRDSSYYDDTVNLEADSNNSVLYDRDLMIFGPDGDVLSTQVYHFSGDEGCPSDAPNAWTRYRNREIILDTKEQADKFVSEWNDSKKIVSRGGRDVRNNSNVLNCHFLEIVKDNNESRNGALKSRLSEDIQGFRGREILTEKIVNAQSDIDYLTERRLIARNANRDTSRTMQAEKVLGAGYTDKAKIYAELTSGRGSIEAGVDDEIIRQRLLEFSENSGIYYFLGLGVMFVFIGFECMPMVAKLLTPMGPYEQSVSVRLSELDQEVKLKNMNDRKVRGTDLDASRQIEKVKLLASVAREKFRSEIDLGIEMQLSSVLDKDLANAVCQEDRLNAIIRHKELLASFDGNADNEREINQKGEVATV